jgi:cell division protein ZapA (FtsZ GTPase activity inhibitor)
MAKSIRVIIGGKEYTLKGQDEKLIQLASREVNMQLEELTQKHSKEPNTTLSILTALNIAEKYFKNLTQMEVDQKFMIKELNEMTNYLDDFLNK